MSNSTRPEDRPARPGRGTRQRITLLPADFVPLSEPDRRAAVKALADLLAAWWAAHGGDRHTGAEDPGVAP
ncbi:MAG: hypothetical protein ACRDT4_18710 [Micromonosporaceae bacterium]